MPISDRYRDWDREEHPPACNCADCVERRMKEIRKVSWAWWLLPIFLMWIGGLIAWGCTKKKIGERAKDYIWLGIAIFIIVGTIIWMALFGI